MNAETIEKLKKYEHFLRQAYFGHYSTPMPSTATKEVFDIYNKEFNAKESNHHCGECRYRVLNKLGERYFKALEITTDPSAVTKVFNAPRTEEPKTDTSSVEPEDTVPKPAPKKKSRKKK